MGLSRPSVRPVDTPERSVTPADRYVRFDRQEWADLRAATPLTIREKDLEALRGINERIDLEEVEAIYLPLTRLLNLYVSAAQELHAVTARFLGRPSGKVPFIIGVAGSVAVGKSTTARVLEALLARWPDHPRVDLVTTDGFLLPNAGIARIFSTRWYTVSSCVCMRRALIASYGASLGKFLTMSLTIRMDS